MPREKTPATLTARKRAPRKSGALEPQAASTFTAFVGQEQRMALIAETAYFLAEKRGFAAGRELDDWVAAEAEVDAKLLRAMGSAPRV